MDAEELAKVSELLKRRPELRDMKALGARLIEAIKEQA
jgi:hypothetical protein